MVTFQFTLLVRSTTYLTFFTQYVSGSWPIFNVFNTCCFQFLDVFWYFQYSAVTILHCYLMSALIDISSFYIFNDESVTPLLSYLVPHLCATYDDWCFVLHLVCSFHTLHCNFFCSGYNGEFCLIWRYWTWESVCSVQGSQKGNHQLCGY